MERRVFGAQAGALLLALLVAFPFTAGASRSCVRGLKDRGNGHARPGGRHRPSARHRPSPRFRPASRSRSGPRSSPDLRPCPRAHCADCRPAEPRTAVPGRPGVRKGARPGHIARGSGPPGEHHPCGGTGRGGSGRFLRHRFRGSGKGERRRFRASDEPDRQVHPVFHDEQGPGAHGALPGPVREVPRNDAGDPREVRTARRPDLPRPHRERLLPEGVLDTPRRRAHGSSSPGRAGATGCGSTGGPTSAATRKSLPTPPRPT